MKIEIQNDTLILLLTVNKYSLYLGNTIFSKKVMHEER